jgi:glycosyltransferase involved in cell wall biosynthesis
MDEAERIRILQAMDVFVLPSAVEGLSLSLLEAMACETACIATDVGGDGEALRGAGIVLDPRELDGQLRLGLQTLLEYPDFRRDLARRARARAVDRYSLRQNLDHLLAIYESLREPKISLPLVGNPRSPSPVRGASGRGPRA